MNLHSFGLRMGPLRQVTSPLSPGTLALHPINSSTGQPFRLVRIVRGTDLVQAASHQLQPQSIMLRTLSMPGQEVFRSMQVHTSSKTPYSDATQVCLGFFFGLGRIKKLSFRIRRSML